MRVCPSCGYENASDAKFCSECGASLLQAVAAREERKVVSLPVFGAPVYATLAELLRRALAFWGTAGARRYLREAEALLPRSA